MGAKPKKKPSNPTNGRPPPDNGAAGLSLSDLRDGISAMDERIIELLNKRAELVVKVGVIKRDKGIPIYTPHREAEVLSRVLAHNRGPLQRSDDRGNLPRTHVRELQVGTAAADRVSGADGELLAPGGGEAFRDLGGFRGPARESAGCSPRWRAGTWTTGWSRSRTRSAGASPRRWRRSRSTTRT